jgi:predicted ABC-type ATPase
MIVIAGPSGSGKSKYFGARDFGFAFFNVDDRCAELNGGSYRAVPIDVRAQAQRECERFVSDCTTQGTSFAVETTLRSTIAIEQAERARIAGFTSKMIFIATDNVQENVRRCAPRSGRGPQRSGGTYHRNLPAKPREPRSCAGRVRRSGALRQLHPQKAPTLGSRLRQAAHRV